jgi:hypothetical protein
MVAERTVNSVTWITDESPSVLTLKGYPHIKARYTRFGWRVDGMHYPFESLAEISDLVIDTKVYLDHRNA